ncbi:MAG: hypothetical protein CVU86_09020 [Firmicutes bacterium HGW-Firmicutes-11]|nr:MAG: hypothetical protein CVU86_09020 [Firmicutes bacterium HGW-Firmicutes-11]
MLRNYAGIRTFTIQSGLRYDHGETSARNVAARLKDRAPLTVAVAFEPADIDFMTECIGISTKFYMQTFLKTTGTVEKIANFIPKNRDRLSSTKTGLEYVREIINLEEIAELMTDDSLQAELLGIDTNIPCAVPRAISFTASMYTLGLPPEFIGIGRCLNVIVSKYGNEGIARLLDCYPQLYDDLSFAAKYVNLKVSKGLIDESARLEYQEDLESACRLLNITGVNEEITEDEFYHTLLKSIRPILMHLFGSQSDLFNDSEEEKKILHEWIIKMGKLRGSLG